MEATGLKMITWTKIKDDFWIAEMSGYRREVTESLLQSFGKQGITLIVLSDRVKE